MVKDKKPVKKKKVKQALGTNKFTSKTLGQPCDQYPWLSNYEASVLLAGGYYDGEGALHNSEGCVRCTSTVKSLGIRCKNFSVPGELFCHIHGGTLARAKNGKQRLYSAFINDPTLHAIYDNVCDAENKEVSGIREELGLLRMLLAKMLATQSLDTPKDVREVANIIGEIRQLVECCTKAEIRLGQLIDIGKIVDIMQQAARIIMKYVKDPEIIASISNEFELITIPNAGTTTPQLEPVHAVRKICDQAGGVCKE